VLFTYHKPGNIGGTVLGGSCRDGWHYYSGYCFYTSETKLDQTTARSECHANGAELASISNQAEMDFVESIS